MARFSDLKFSYRLYMKAYRYRSHDWLPGATLRKPPSEAKVACVTTAAFYLPEHEPFDEEMKGGDYSYREISLDADLSTLRIGHRSDAFDPSGIEADPNVALPLDRLRELAAERVIGPVSERHFSFQGSIPAPGRLVTQSAPEVAQALLADQVDLVLLTPV